MMVAKRVELAATLAKTQARGECKAESSQQQNAKQMGKNTGVVVMSKSWHKQPHNWASWALANLCVISGPDKPQQADCKSGTAGIRDRNSSCSWILPSKFAETWCPEHFDASHPRFRMFSLCAINANWGSLLPNSTLRFF